MTWMNLGPRDAWAAGPRDAWAAGPRDARGAREQHTPPGGDLRDISGTEEANTVQGDEVLLVLLHHFLICKQSRGSTSAA